MARPSSDQRVCRKRARERARERTHGGMGQRSGRRGGEGTWQAGSGTGEGTAGSTCALWSAGMGHAREDAAGEGRTRGGRRVRGCWHG